MNESCELWKSYITYELVLSCMYESCHKWVMSHIYDSCHIWLIHVTHEWVIALLNEKCDIWMSHITNEWVMCTFVCNIIHRHIGRQPVQWVRVLVRMAMMNSLTFPAHYEQAFAQIVVRFVCSTPSSVTTQKKRKICMAHTHVDTTRGHSTVNSSASLCVCIYVFVCEIVYVFVKGVKRHWEQSLQQKNYNAGNKVLQYDMIYVFRLSFTPRVQFENLDTMYQFCFSICWWNETTLVPFSPLQLRIRSRASFSVRVPPWTCRDNYVQRLSTLMSVKP